MANRFPLTIDGSTIKELASGDNLDLTGSGISISSNQGNANQVLISTGSGVAWADASGGSSTFGVSTMTGDGSDTTLTLSADPGSENNTQVYIDGVYQPKSSYSVSGTTLTFSTAPPTGTSVEAIVGASSSAGVPSDASVTSAKLSGALTTPSSLTLGGNLDVSGHDIVTVSNADIELDPNGSGTVVFKGNATKGAGQLKLNCENNSHGITIKGPPHSAAASYTLTLPNTDGSADQVLKTDGSGNLDWVDSGGGGGAWNVISSTTVSSNVASVSLTLSGYANYAILFTGITSQAGSSYDFNKWEFSTDNGSNFLSSGIDQTETRKPSWTGGSPDTTGRSNVSYVEIGEVYASGDNTDGLIYLFNNVAGNTRKVGRYEGAKYSSSGVMSEHGAFMITTTPVITTIRYRSHGNNNLGINGGKFVLYGLATS